MPSSTNPDTPQGCSPHTAGHHETDPRPHVATLLELAALGWYVTAIRPDLSETVLWRVTIVRYDLSAWITATDADPDDALDELIRYAAADAEERSTMPAAATATDAPAAGPEEP
jgi:hypothetical protein